ncbi:Gfo/Idh/MocA family oxidoreductase [Aestuariibacter sp. A3R04]|uniref:Gfo/Idh/MocA family oxidoreductase n=1 Tax=Aestuariibacter sp. A3R04 TaxID=2841571 RepID=UPI001C0A0DC0|nr:Gfo/Idh/MocA family oxidoreductase [Aestuariibacter sp. A3R04]MBU3020461.1 Gfo/Idh/MocA family oxidoreductase [Aestuariibacter sp. A3R04]
MINTVLVGFGFSATTFHLPFLSHLANFRIKAVVSSRPDEVAAVLPDVPVFRSLTKALETGHTDLVVITTPNVYHAMQARQALSAGCHVLVEKPFTLSSVDAKELVAMANAKQRKLCIYHNRRFDGDFLTVKALMASGRLGNVKRFTSRFDRFRPRPRDRWRENAGPGAGIFWDLGPHLIDQALQLFGAPTQITADIQIAREGGESDDCFDLTLHYGDKTVLLGSSPFQAGKTLRFDVQGDTASFRKFGLDPQESQLKAGVHIGSEGWAQTPQEEHGELSSEVASDIVMTEQGQYQTFYQQLADALQSECPLPVDGASVVPVIQLIELAFESAETGKTMPVYLDMKENN